MMNQIKSWNVQYTEKAKIDLKAIVSYIKNVLFEPIIASNIYDELVTAIRSLEKMPYRCHIYDGEPWKQKGIRVLKVKNYLVFYKPDEELNTVWVIRIIYAGRDISKQLIENE